MSGAGVVGRSHAMSLMGLDATPILIEAVLLHGLPNFTIVGLPDAAVNEARERLRAGFLGIGLTWPNQRLTVNLSPGDVTKSGTGFDLGLAVAILGSLGFRPCDRWTVTIGELGLDGEVRAVSGVLPAVMAARNKGFVRAIVPAANAREASLVDGIEIVSVHHLAQIAVMFGVPDVTVPPAPAYRQPSVAGNDATVDLVDICGQEEAIMALEVAAAGSHHMLMVGPPGVGKSMLAERLPGVLPDLDRESAVGVAAIKSLDGDSVTVLPKRPPYVAPHHSATTAALVGGGSGIPKPGDITRAHHGVLFCDEFPEFAPQVIQALRQPMEKGWIDLSRVHARVRYPAQFQLVAAANPCRCGMRLDGPGKCTCTSRERRAYASHLGGPVRDRIDIRINLARPSRADIKRGGTVTTAEVHERVTHARERQRERSQHTGVALNSQLSGSWLRKHTKLEPHTSALFDRALAEAELSMRGVDRILRLAWSVADLAGHDAPNDDDVALAYSLRSTGGVA